MPPTLEKPERFPYSLLPIPYSLIQEASGIYGLQPQTPLTHVVRHAPWSDYFERP